jgi:effector-binding domain-containing protein
MRKTRLFALCAAIAVVSIAAASYALPPKATSPKAVTPKVAATKPDTAARVYLKYTEPHSYAVMSHTGPYAELATVIGKLAADMDKGGYLQAGPIMTGFINNVETTPAKDLKWQVMIPVSNPGVFGPVPNDKMGFKYQDPVYVAYIFHAGPYDKINESYKILFDWAKRNGYNIQGFPVEVYWSDQVKTPKEKLVTEIWIPIEEKKTPNMVR